MTESGVWIPGAVALTAFVVIASGVAKALLERIRIPGLVGFLLIGVAIRLANDQWNFMDQQTRDVFSFLAEVGIVVLLFRVGLESNITNLLRQLHSALFVWIGNILASGALGFIAAYYLLDFDLIPSLFLTVALTATSVGVVVDIWRSAGALNTPKGDLLLDVAELDDISAVLLLSILVSVAPRVASGETDKLALSLAGPVLWAFAKAIAFAGAGLVFARFAERRITRFAQRFERQPDPLLTILGIAFLISALAAALEFSIAMGAFFAGLAFSRDPDAVAMDTGLVSIFEFFLPFFFVGIGLAVDPGVLGPNMNLIGLILAVAIAGKLIGAGVPVWKTTGATGGLLIGVSMIPRAEFTMLVMRTGSEMGERFVPANLFAATVGIVLVTSIITPIVLIRLLERWPPGGSRKEAPCQSTC